MDGHIILISGPELGHKHYEACFLPHYFDEFKWRVQKTLKVIVSAEELEKWKECDYHVFCKEVSEKLLQII